MFLRLLFTFIWLFAVSYQATNRSLAQTYIQQDRDLTALHEQEDTLEAFRIIQAGGRTGNLHPDSGLSLLEQGYSMSYRLGYSYGIAKSLQISSVIYSHTGRFEQGIEQLRKMIYYCLATGKHTDLLAVGYNILGNIYQTQGKYEEAAYYYHQTLLLPRAYLDESTIALIYANLSRLTHKLKQPRKALYYLDQSEIIAAHNKNYDLLCTINSNRGMIYADIGQSDSAILFLNKTQRLIRKHNKDYRSLQDIEYSNMVYLADVWLQQGNLDSAGVCIHRIHQIHTPVVPLYWNKAHLTTGKFYLEKRNYKQAEYYLLKALDSIRHNKANNDLANIHLALSELYNTTGNCPKALRHNMDYIRIKDSLESQQVTHAVHQLEVRYRTAEKDRELIRQKLEISRQQNDVREKNLWIAIVTGCMVTVLILLAALYKKRQADLSLKQKELKTLQQAQEIAQLKAMMKGEERERSRLARELHDGIGGMLTAVTLNLNAATRKNPELSKYSSLTELMQMLEDTGSEIRKTAHNLMPDVLVRHTLPEALMIFCTHIHEELPIDLSCEGDFSQLDKATELMVYRMTQELIQNIVKHASATQAAIQLYIYEGILSLMVEDNGTGFDVRQKEHNGFGLENLKYRINALEGDISITSDASRSTIIQIEFELEKLRNINL